VYGKETLPNPFIAEDIARPKAHILDINLARNELERDGDSIIVD
jgi:hypothetical protein